MATEQQHLERARANESFSNTISPISQAEWKIVTAFYAALHYVEAIIVRSGRQSVDHTSRTMLISQIPELRKVRADYETMRNYAREARYDPTTNFGASQIVQDICDLLPEIRRQLGFRQI